MRANRVLFIVAVALLFVAPSYAYSIGPTAWDPGPDHARWSAGNPAPGSANWSIMPAGLGVAAGQAAIDDPSHVGFTTEDFDSLVPTVGWEEQVIDQALDEWDLWSGFTNLGEVPDGGGQGGADDAGGGGTGDIRVAAWAITDANVLAHAFYPGTWSDWGSDWNFGGDVHFDTGWVWVDDATDTTVDPDFDFYTVALHELGHSLGLEHSSDINSVMYPVYQGARRTLKADDIAGIQAIYGLQQVVPEPASVCLLGLAGGAIAAVVKKRKKAA